MKPPEETMPCLFCGGEMMMMEGFGAYWLGCRSAYDMGCRDAYDGGDNCGYATPCYASPTEAIAAHNRIATAVRDHATLLARVAELEAQVERLRETLREVQACMDTATEYFAPRTSARGIFDGAFMGVSKKIGYALAVTAPDEEAAP